MSYLVLCTFDLKSASAADYQNAYTDLARIGLQKVHKSDSGGDVVIPTTAAMGQFNGNSAPEVRSYVRDQVKAAFQARRFKAEIFLVVGGNWAWGAAST
jgi:hypothetical protein